MGDMPIGPALNSGAFPGVSPEEGKGIRWGDGSLPDYTRKSRSRCGTIGDEKNGL